MADLQSEHARLMGAVKQVEANLNAGEGALQTIAYFKGVWFQPSRPSSNSTHASTALVDGSGPIGG
jgi:hypothetical protein